MNYMKRIAAIFAFSFLVLGLPGFAKQTVSSQDAKMTKAEKAVAKAEAKLREKKRKAIFLRYPYNEEKYHEAILSGDYKTARFMLEGLPSLNYAQLIDLGMLQYYAGKFSDAATSLEAATNAIGEDFVKRLKKDGSEKTSFATKFVNDNYTAYHGSIYEFLLVDAFNALNFYREAFKKGFQYGEDEDDLLERAYNHIVRVYERRNQYGQLFDFLLAEESGDDEEKGNDFLKKVGAYSSVLGDAGHFYYSGAGSIDTTLSVAGLGVRTLERIMPARAKSEDIYRASALADYLQIVLSRQYNETMDDDHGPIIAELKTLAPQVDMSFYNSFDSSKGRIEVLALAGLIAQKAEHFEIIPTNITIGGEMVSAKFSWPEYREDSANIRVPPSVKITLNNGASKKAIVLEDFDLAVKSDIALNARKDAARHLIRAATSLSEARTADSHNQKVIDEGRGNIITVDSIYEGVFLTQKSDLRQALALPSKAYCAGFDVAPGTYSITIDYGNGKSETIENVVVYSGRPTLVESICN